MASVLSSSQPRAVARHARDAMVASIDQLASEAGVALLRRGGSAADAAIGANAVLAVTCPNMCGIGGDLWALVHSGSGPPAALDATGPAGSGADPDRARADGLASMPMQDDIRAVTVPGAVDGWLALHDRFGALELETVLWRAIDLAENGFPAHPMLAESVGRVAGIEGSDLPPRVDAGQIITRPGTARTLRAIQDRGRDGFYGGEFGEGLLSLGPEEFASTDLEVDLARWVTPLGLRAFDAEIWTVPPTSQGYVTLLASAIADGFEFDDNVEGIHLLVESLVQAAHDRPDRLFDGADVSPLLDPGQVAQRRALVDRRRTAQTPIEENHGDTTFLCAVDADGMGVALINSNAHGYGSHLVAGSTGILLHNRGIGFSLERGHPAEYGPRRRPPHTLAPAIVLNRAGSLRALVGTQGGDTQPQVVLQLLDGILRSGLDPGEAVARPRWRVADAGGSGFSTWSRNAARRLELEHGFSLDVAAGLGARGHTCVSADHHGFGQAQLIEVTAHGTLAGAADPRALAGSASGF